MGGLLEGIRVLDFSHYVAGPVCCMLLADAGAEVVKVEPPGGDPVRRFPSSFARGSRLFIGLNRNKKSLVLNLKTERGRELVGRLADGADVLVESFRPGVEERLGLGYDSLSARNPRLIYCSLSAYGESGPMREQPGIDPAVQTFAGLPLEQDPEGPPRIVNGSFIDYYTGSLTAYAVLLALIERGRSARGQFIASSLLGGAVALQAGRLVWGEGEPPEGVRDALSDRIARIYETADGHLYVYLDVPGFWERGLSVLGLGRLGDEPRFATMQGRHDHRGEIIPQVQEVLRRAPTAAWEEKFQAARVPCARARLPVFLLEDPQALSQGYVARVEHPLWGALRIVGVPLALSRTPLTVRSPAPALGEHSAEVLGELGLGEGEIAKLREEGVVG